MGGFNPITSVLGAASNILSLGRDAYNYNTINRDYSNAQNRYAQTENEIAQDRAQQKQQLALQAEQDGAARRSALKRVMAKQQAEFGAQGIDTTDGSGQAVLLGLFKESDDEKNYRDKLDALKNTSIDQDADNRRKRNLLDLQDSYARAQGRIVNYDYTSPFTSLSGKKN